MGEVEAWGAMLIPGEKLGLPASRSRAGLASGCPGGKRAGSGFGLLAMGSVGDNGQLGLPNPY